MALRHAGRPEFPAAAGAKARNSKGLQQRRVCRHRLRPVFSAHLLFLDGVVSAGPVYMDVGFGICPFQNVERPIGRAVSLCKEQRPVGDVLPCGRQKAHGMGLIRLPNPVRRSDAPVWNVRGGGGAFARPRSVWVLSSCFLQRIWRDDRRCSGLVFAIVRTGAARWNGAFTKMDLKKEGAACGWS